MIIILAVVAFCTGLTSVQESTDKSAVASTLEKKGAYGLLLLAFIQFGSCKLSVIITYIRIEGLLCLNLEGVTS
ncbi:hypothetical protein DUZ99_06760 [Xylanibacillus composti]|nr:hypothetical protein [Xylanibacillus composti]